MVSGFRTSPYDLSRMESGEANPIVIFEKVALGRFSFLIAILQYAVFIFIPTQLITNLLSLFWHTHDANKPKLRRAKVRIYFRKMFFPKYSVPKPARLARIKINCNL